MVQRVDLTAAERRHTFAVIESCYDVHDDVGFRRFVLSTLDKVLPHEHFACGIASTRNRFVHSLINLTFPPAYISQIIPPDGVIVSPTFRAWQRTGRPRCFNRKTIASAGARWREAFHDYGMQTISGHGIQDVHGGMAAYFGFGNLDRPWDAKQAYLMELLVPHLYVTAMRFLSPAMAPVDLPRLTLRQQEVLKWIAVGKSSWEIGRILGVSERTVKVHTAFAMRKLDVHTRAHAVAKALSLRLIAI